MLRRTVCSMLVAFAATTQAQIGRQRPVQPSGPDYWVGLSVGYLDGASLSDDATGALWRFGYSTVLRGTFEKTIARGTTVGLAAGFATAPLTYEGGSSSGACGFGCRADADIAQYTVFIRAGGGPGFHVLFNGEGGVTQFSKFREHATEVSLPPKDSGYDTTLGFGAGFSYGFSSITDAYVEQMTDFVLHRQSSDAINQSAPRLYSFRGGFRIGF